MVLVLHRPAFAQQSPVTAIGRVTGFHVSGQTMLLPLSNAYASITIYSPTMIRVRITPTQPTGDFSYAVTGEPVPTRVVTSEDKGFIRINTDSLHVIVAKDPFALTFLNNRGDTINADEPGLTTSRVGADITTYKHLQPGERFVGLGEKNGDLDRRGSGFVDWNSDFYGYSITQDPLYSSIPFYIGIHGDVRYGLFLDNSYQTDFNFGASNDRFSSFRARGGDMNYYLIYHTRVPDVITEYTALTGRMPLPPLWSLGYQQNRYSYFPDTEVLRIAQTLREKKIPSDGVTLDIHYMDAYKLFTWDPARFPDPKGLTDRLKAMGFRLTVIVDPGIKAEKGYPAYESGLKSDVFLKYPDGTNYTAKVWPGWCHFPDFTSVRGRDWWSNQVKTYTAQGVSGLWNDMNEISTWGQQVPENILFDFDGHPTTMAQGHNVFALEMVRASYTGARAAGERPFILTRSGFAGLQRYSAIWTGDNRAEETHLLAGIRLMASLGLSGVPFTGMDIGGFTGNPPAPLFARWMQVGAFLPYYRNHTALDTRSSEPWTYGETILEISRNYVSLRYKLLPYLYSVFYEASQDGLPVLRSLAIDYTGDASVYTTDFQNQFLFGPSMLVAPVTGDAAYAGVYLPRGLWYNLYNGAVATGGQVTVQPLTLRELPVYVRGGAILPMQSLVQSTAEIPGDTLYVHVYKGDEPNAFTYYEDDGISYNYEKGNYYRRLMRYEPGTLTLDKPEGAFPTKFHHITLLLHGFDTLNQVNINGIAQPLADTTYSFLALPDANDPQARAIPDDPAPTRCPVKTVTISNSADRLTIRL